MATTKQSSRPGKGVAILCAVAVGAGLSIATMANAAPSQKSLRKAFTANLAGTWGDVYPNGAEPALPEGWAMFGCGPQPAFVIAGSDKAGFSVKLNNMETGPLEGALVVGEAQSKTSGRVVMPDVLWERRLSFKNRDLLVLDAVENPEDKPSAQARYLKRCPQ